jgi:uncharacterized membrane protein YkvA (DUF1232 family)
MRRAEALARELVVLYFAYRDPEVGLLPRIVIVIALGYALSPIDLVPDFIPILGQLDDLIIVSALIALSIRLIPGGVLDRARERADREPVLLGKRWLFTIIFALLWAVLVGVIVFALVDVFVGKQCRR